jgi:hypothetical protein
VQDTRLQRLTAAQVATMSENMVQLPTVLQSPSLISRAATMALLCDRCGKAGHFAESCERCARCDGNGVHPVESAEAGEPGTVLRHGRAYYMSTKCVLCDGTGLSKLVRHG